VLEHTGVVGAMTERARAEYLERLEKKPPPFTLKALEDLAQNADRIYSEGFEQTIKEVRQAFIGCHYTGGDWRMQKKDNLQRIESQFRSRGPISWDIYMRRFSIRDGGKFNDLLTACRLLDGKPRPTYADNFLALADKGLKDGPIVVTPYFKVQAFKNGNHLTTWNPEREDILERLNRWGSDENTIGDTKRKRYKREHFENGGFDTSTAAENFQAGPDLQFYRTPPDLVRMLLEYAEPENGLRYLEPSAGDGAIATQLIDWVDVDADGHTSGIVQAFEIDHDRAMALSGKAYIGLAVKHADFLKEKPEDWAKFDRIVMNPPFHNQADAIHVLHALRFLEPHGGLVAVMGAGIESSQTRTAKALRDAIRARGGRFEPNPADSFKVSGTRVRTVTLVIPPKKPENEG
jgi:predicted RNA methylase